MADGKIHQQNGVQHPNPGKHFQTSFDVCRGKTIVALPASNETLENTPPEVEVVGWDTPTDDDDPLRWPSGRKWLNVILIAAQGTLTPISGTLPTIATPLFAQDFHTSSAILPTLPFAFYVLGLGLGPLYLAPLSELYGRRLVYVVSFSLFAVLNVGCALAPSLSVLSALRFLSGMAGSAGPSLGGASIGDMFSKVERGRAQALYSFGPTGGPIIGGVLGGFILDGTGSWRWLMWVTAIAPAVTAVISILFLRETYVPILLKRKAARLQKAMPEKCFRVPHSEMNAVDKIWQSVIRPMNFLVTSPICSLLAFYIALLYGIFYLHMLSLSLLFSSVPQFGLATYGWSHGTSGLSFLGAGTGILLGNLLSAQLSNRAYAYMNARKSAKLRGNNASPEVDKGIQEIEHHSESRMLLFEIGTVVVPIGLIMFAWSAARTHWSVPLVGAAILATGTMVVYVAFQTYVVDVFGRYAASALATSMVLRSMAACILIMFGIDLYKAIGYAWGTMLLAFICILIIPVPFLLYRYGPKLRQKERGF